MMTGLPSLVQRAPSLFYGAALIFFVSAVVLNQMELNSTMAYADPGNPMVMLARLRGLYQAALESVYLAANGVIAHILIAIWRDRRAPRDGGGES